MLFFDSSAIIEVLNGNEVVVAAYKDAPLITIDLVYGEVYYFCLRAKIAPEQLQQISMEIVPHTLEDIKSAMELLYHRKQLIKDFSFVDALVYTVSRRAGCILVTKDFGFKGLPGVEFVQVKQE